MHREIYSTGTGYYEETSQQYNTATPSAVTIQPQEESGGTEANSQRAEAHTTEDSPDSGDDPEPPRSVVEWAQLYKKNGFNPIPIKPRTKEPAVNAVVPYRSRIISDSEIQSYFHDGYNIAHVVNDLEEYNICILDYDTKAIPERVTTLEEYMSDHAQVLMGHPLVQSPSGSIHSYVKLHKSIPKNKSKEQYHYGNLPIELIRTGAYCLLPPSYFQGDDYSGNYKLISGSLSDIKQYDTIEALIEEFDLTPGTAEQEAPKIGTDTDGVITDRMEYYASQCKGDTLSDACKAIIEAPDGEQNDTILEQARLCYIDVYHGRREVMAVDSALIGAGVTGNHPIDRIKSTIESAKKYAQKYIAANPPQPQIRVEENPSTIRYSDEYSKPIRVREALRKHFKFRRNVITGKYYFKEHASTEWLPLTDKDYNTIWLFLCDKYLKTLAEGIVRQVVESDFAEDYDPIKEYLESLPFWDGKDYINELASLITTAPGQEEIWRKYIKRWLIANIATLKGNGINHSCLILIGPQGSGKSSFLNRLGISPELTFTGSINPIDKDSRILLAEKALINLDELDSSTREDWSYIKSIITLPQVTVRRPYARTAEDLPRRASFCGSVNRSSVLGDLTGSRRWLCVEIEKIDFLSVTPELMKLVYSQALSLLETGEKYWFDGEEIQKIHDTNKQYQQITSEEELLKSYLYPADDPAHKTGIPEQLTTTEILKKITSENPGIRVSVRVLGQLLKSGGYKRVMRSDHNYSWEVIRREE